jgi:hypothetical protein
MYTQAPPLDNSFPDNQQPLYDYATDVEPSSGANTDKGVQELPATDCTLVGNLIQSIPLVSDVLDPNAYLKVHKWLTPKIPSGFNNIVFTGAATLNLWTQTINSGIYGGGICVSLFTRHLNLLNAPVDTPILTSGLLSVSKVMSPWPSGGWTELSINVPVVLGLSLPVGYQLGLAIGVDQSHTGGGLQFAYDAPSYDSRLQIQTTGSLPF